MKLVLVLAVLIGAAWAQQTGICECGIFIREPAPLEPHHGPIYSYPSTNITCDSGADEIDCQFNCSIYFRFTLTNQTWDDIVPGTNETWAPYTCRESFAALGWTTDDPNDVQCLTTYMESRYRLEGCTSPGQEWQQAIDETRDFCCDQMANFVPGCPPPGP